MKRPNILTVFLFLDQEQEKFFSHSSDLDIGILGTKAISDEIINKIKDEIEESIVPFHVDIIDFYMADEEFKKVALRDIIVWNRPNHITIN